MKTNYIHKSKYFYGNEISSYGLEHSRIDYATLAKAFDAVLCNDITKLFYSTVNGEYVEPEMLQGFIDHDDEIDALTDEMHELIMNNDDGSKTDEIDALQEKIDALEWEKHEEPFDIYQYYIISESGARILQDLTNEIIYYIAELDIYIWGITHFGTSWSYVLTDIKIDLEGKN